LNRLPNLWVELGQGLLIIKHNSDSQGKAGILHNPEPSAYPAAQLSADFLQQPSAVLSPRRPARSNFLASSQPRPGQPFNTANKCSVNISHGNFAVVLSVPSLAVPN